MEMTRFASLHRSIAARSRLDRMEFIPAMYWIPRRLSDSYTKARRAGGGASRCVMTSETFSMTTPKSIRSTEEQKSIISHPLALELDFTKRLQARRATSIAQRRASERLTIDDCRPSLSSRLLAARHSEPRAASPG